MPAAGKRPLRQLLPKDLDPSDVHPPNAPERPPKRSQTLVACEYCRKRKGKCDGRRPQCTACEKKKLDCQWPAPEWVHPRQADKEQIAKYQSVWELFQHGSADMVSQAIQKIRQPGNVADSVTSIADAQLLLPSQSFTGISAAGAPPMGTHPVPRLFGFRKHRVMAPHDDPNFIFEKQFFQDARDQYVHPDLFVHVAAQQLPLVKWTTVSADNELLNHLFLLFFTWDNTPERVIYRPILEEDITGLDPRVAEGRNDCFCTPFFISALLAASCVYTLDPTTFKTPGDPNSRGKLWADEAESRLRLTDTHEPSIPLLQGLYCIFAYEANFGSGAKAIGYFMQAIGVYEKLNNSLDGIYGRKGVDSKRVRREEHAISWCMWGVYCTEWRSAQAFGWRKITQKPKVDKEWYNNDFGLSKTDCVGWWWYPYPEVTRVQRSLQVEVREADVCLSIIAEDALEYLFPDLDSGQPLPTANPQRALEIYDAFLEWKFSLPDCLRLEEAVLPSVILLHAVLEIMFTAILRPFSNMPKEQFGRFDPRERCFSHASSLMSVVWTFRSFAQIRLEYWLVHPIGTSVYVILDEAEDAPVRMDILMRGCRCLEEMKGTIPLAGDVLSGFRAAFKRYGINVPTYMQKYFGEVQKRQDGILHYTVAALLPKSAEEGNASSEGDDLLLQELLEDFAGFNTDEVH